MNQASISDRRIRAVAASVAIAACAYLFVSAFIGWRAVIDGLLRAGALGVALALSMSTLNYLLRFLRWDLYLRTLGHRVPVVAHARIYLSGFALTTTPGKAGEAIRSVFLARHGVAYASSLAAMFSERISDVAAVLILCLPGLDLDPHLHALVLVPGAGITVGLVLLAWPGWLRWMQTRAEHLQGRLGHMLRHSVQLMLNARRCNTPRLLALANVLSLVAWGAEALAFRWICARLGMHLALGYGVFVYAASMIAGGISLMPGGLGGTEATMVALLVLKGAAAPDAVAATVLIRLTTLWFAVFLGLGALLGMRRPQMVPT